ncbi:BhlA/UviB family holin-like peptide [Desulforamulus reducens]|uniref:BhlA/UviB family holin-like peptide n=1 Tax=Desulforamulus reducens TaxID=59610 RepID=UPI0002EFF588|nr:BhlA/UviB family holin-like peptide [Desulforamulus reducens]
MDILNADTMQLIVSQGIFAVLFVWLLYDTRKESKIREELLMQQISKSEEAHNAIIRAIEHLANKLGGI